MTDRTHLFEIGDRVIWHNEIAVVNFPGYRGEDRVRIELPPWPSGTSQVEYRWVNIASLRHEPRSDTD